MDSLKNHVVQVMDLIRLATLAALVETAKA
jgi:hypothetical protein